MIMQTPSDCKALFSVFLTNGGNLRFIFEPGVEEMIEQHRLHELVGDVVAEFGENYKFKNRTQVKDLAHDNKRIIIPKGAIF